MFGSKKWRRRWYYSVALSDINYCQGLSWITMNICCPIMTFRQVQIYWESWPFERVIQVRIFYFKGIYMCFAVESYTEEKYKFTFRIVTIWRTLNLRASNEQEKKTWMKVIGDVINNAPNYTLAERAGKVSP
jgi:hypothetical protein